MALITSFERMETTEGKLQPTRVVGRYKVFERDRTKILQVDTLGSEQRETPGRQSQTFQLNEESARALHKLLAETYGFR